MSSNPQQQGFDVDAWLEAISEQESGGDYGIQRQDKHRATGKYQVITDNIGPWTKEVYGAELTPEEFASMPDVQEEVARYKFSQYHKQRGGNLAEVAKDWYGRGKTQPGHPTPDQYANSIVAKYDAARKRRSAAPAPDQQPVEASDDELNKLAEAYSSSAAAPSTKPTTKANEGDISPDGAWKFQNHRWQDNLGRLPSELPGTGEPVNRDGTPYVEGQQPPAGPKVGIDAVNDNIIGVGGGRYNSQGGLISLPTSTEPMREGYVAPSTDYLGSSGPASDAELKQIEKRQAEAARYKKRNLMVPHSGNLTLEQANDSLVQFVFGGDAATARKRQDAAIRGKLLDAPLSVLTDDHGQPLNDPAKFNELVAGRSKADSLGNYSLPITVNEQAVALRERFNKEAGVDPDDYVALQNEQDPMRQELIKADIERKSSESKDLNVFRQLASQRLSTMAPWEQPNSPEAKKAWIDSKAKEIAADEPLANTVGNFFGLTGGREAFSSGADRPQTGVFGETMQGGVIGVTQNLMKTFNPLAPFFADPNDPEYGSSFKDGYKGVASFFSGLTFGALSEYDPRFDEGFRQLSPEQQKKFTERADLALTMSRSAGTTAGIALLLAAPGGLAGGAVGGLGRLGAAGSLLEDAAIIARGAKAAKWIQGTIQASGFNGVGIGSSIAQASVYAAVDEAVKTGAPTLDAWAAGGGWNPNVSTAQNVAEYFGRFVKRLPDDSAQFIIGNQWGAVAEKLAADYGLGTLGREAVGRFAEGAGEAVQELGTQIYNGKLDKQALYTAGILGALMGHGGSNAPIYVVSANGHHYKLNMEGGLDLVSRESVEPNAEVLPEKAVLGNAAMGVDDFYEAVYGKSGVEGQVQDVQSQNAVESGEVQMVGGPPASQPAKADLTAQLAEAHRGYRASEAAGDESLQTVFGGDEAVRQAASSANEVEQQLRQDPEAYISEQENDAEALAGLAASVRQVYEGKAGPDSVLGIEGDAIAPITDKDQLREAVSAAVVQAATAPDGTVDPIRQAKLAEIVTGIGNNTIGKKEFLEKLDAAAATQQATAKSIRDEFGSKIGQERRAEAELRDASAEGNRIGQEMQALNDTQRGLNEERRATRDAVRDAEDYVLTAEDGVVEAEDAVAQAQDAAQQARVPLEQALARGATASQKRDLRKRVEAADAKVELAQKGVEKAKQMASRAKQAAVRAKSADSRKLEDLQDLTKAYGAKQKEFKAAQDRAERAYSNREAFIKEQKKEAAEAKKANTAPAKTTEAKQTAVKPSASPVTATKPATGPKAATAEATEQTDSTEYAGPEVESSPDISSKKPADRAKFLKDPVNAASLADRALANLDNGDGTGSSTYIDGSEATEGYAVATGLTEVVEKGQDTTEAISKFIAREDVRAALAENPNSVLGTHVDAGGNTHLEVSEVYDNEADAIEAGDIGAQQGYQRLGEPEGYQPLPFGQMKKSIATRLKDIVGPAVGFHMSEQDSLDYAQILTSQVSLAAKDANRGIEEQFTIMVKNGLLGILGHSIIRVGGSSLPAHVAEDGTVTLAMRTMLPKDFVNLYMTPVTAPPEGLSKVDNDKIAEALNALVGDKIEPFDLSGSAEGRDERFQEWKAKVIERYVESWVVDIKDAFNIAEVSPNNFKIKGFNDSKTIKAGKQKDITRKDGMALLERGLNWYDKGKKEAIANVAKHRPELRVDKDGKPVDPFAYIAFATILGAHSPGNKPVSNGPQAIEHYVDWQAQRDEAIAADRDPDLVPLPLVNLAAFANVEQDFEIDGKPVKTTLKVPGASYSRAGHSPVIGINEVARIKFGGNIRQSIEWMHTLHPRSEVLDMARQLKGGQVELPREAMIPGSFVLGTKIGAFIGNLGGNLDFVTIDLWQGTGYNRQMGTIGGDGLARNEWEAEAEQAAVEALAKVLEKEWRGRGRLGRQMREAFGPPRALKPAEVQGLTWYIEQQIWAAHGHTGVESVSYEESTKEYSDNWDSHQARREQGRKDVEAAWRSDLYTTTSPDREALAGRKLEANEEGRVDPNTTFGASPDLTANAATVQFLIDSLAHYKTMPSLVVSQITPGEAEVWGPLVPMPVEDGAIGPLPDKKEESDRRNAYNRKVRSSQNASKKALAKQEATFAANQARVAKQQEWEQGLGRPLPVGSWVVMRSDAPVPHSAYDTKEQAAAAAQQLKDYRGEFQQGVIRLAGLEAQRDFLIKEIQKATGKSREDVEAQVAADAAVHAALLPIRTELYSQSGKGPEKTVEEYGFDYAVGPEEIVAEQEGVDSAATSQSQVPALHNKIEVEKGDVIVDIGGGKYDHGKDALLAKGAKSVHVLDPFNRTAKHNGAEAKKLDRKPANKALIANVLNVIPTEMARANVLKAARRYVKPGGKVYIAVYEGSGGVAKATSKGWQENRPLKSYLEEVQAVYPDAKIEKGYIVATVQGPVERFFQQGQTREEQINSEAFKKWFGDSKVVGPDGKPMVVYHGSGQRFTEFSKDKTGSSTDSGYLGRGFYFGDRGHAALYAQMGYEAGQNYAEDKEWMGDPFIPVGSKSALYPVYLSLQNPLELHERPNPDAPHQMQDREAHIRQELGLPKDATSSQVTAAAQEQGHDGVVFNYATRAPGGPKWLGEKEYVVFDPTGIKSAIGNTGAFDGTKESILHQLGPTLKGEIQRIASIGGAPTTDALVTILAGKPEYLSGVANYLIKQQQKLLAGEMTVRDVAKAYIITLSSMGATEQHVAGKDAQSAKAGPDPQMQTGADVGNIPAADFLSQKKGKTMVRPEDFMAKFFLTKDGQAMLDHVEEVAAGKVALDPAVFAPMTAVRAGFGNHITTTDFAFSEPKAGVYTLSNIAEFVKELNAAGKTGDPEAMLKTVTKLKGVAEGKKGFIGQLLGFGGAVTVDAVEINTWLLGKGSVAKGTAEPLLTTRATRPDVAPMMRRLVEQGMAKLAMDPRIANQLSSADLDPNAFNTIMHHWLWDRMKGTETSHAGLYKAMELAHSEDSVGQIMGMVAFAGMGPSTINYYVGATAATMAHEPVHAYRRFMPKADLQIAEKWVAKATGLKVHNGQWLREHDEALARGFEQWLLEGKLPANAPEGLLGVFERMKAAILAVYQDHDQYKQKGQVDDFVGRLDDNINGVFERMLGLRTTVGTPSQQAAFDSYGNRVQQGQANFDQRYAVAQAEDEKFARDMMLTYCRWDFRRMPIADQRALLEEIFEVQRDGVVPRTLDEVLGPVFAGRVDEFRASKVPAMGQAALQRRLAKRLSDGTQMSPQFDSDARQILDIYKFGQNAFNALYPNKQVAKRGPAFTLYLAHYHPQLLLNVTRARAKLAGTDIFSDSWLTKEQTLRTLIQESLYTPTFVNVTFNQATELHQVTRGPVNLKPKLTSENIDKMFRGMTQIPARELEGFMKTPKRGVTADEFADSGLLELIEAKTDKSQRHGGMVSVADIKATVAEHQIQPMLLVQNAEDAKYTNVFASDIGGELEKGVLANKAANLTKDIDAKRAKLIDTEDPAKRAELEVQLNDLLSKEQALENTIAEVNARTPERAAEIASEDYAELLVFAPGKPRVRGAEGHYFSRMDEVGHQLIADMTVVTKTINGKRFLYLLEQQSDVHQDLSKKPEATALAARHFFEETKQAKDIAAKLPAPVTFDQHQYALGLEALAEAEGLDLRSLRNIYVNLRLRGEAEVAKEEAGHPIEAARAREIFSVQREYEVAQEAYVGNFDASPEGRKLRDRMLELSTGIAALKPEVFEKMGLNTLEERKAAKEILVAMDEVWSLRFDKPSTIGEFAQIESLNLRLLRAERANPTIFNKVRNLFKERAGIIDALEAGETKQRADRLKEGFRNIPFQKSWIDLSMKTLVGHAAANGYDGIILPSGEAIDARWPDKSKKQKGKAGKLTHYNQKLPKSLEKALRKTGVTATQYSQPVGIDPMAKLYEFSAEAKSTLASVTQELYQESGSQLYSANPPQSNAAAIAAAAQQVAAAFNNLNEATWQEIVADVRKAGMLSGIRTHLGNVISNTAFQIVEEAARHPAVAADMLMRLRYGQRSISASQADNIKAMIHAFSLKDTPNVSGSADPEKLELARKAGISRFMDELWGIGGNSANSQTAGNTHGWNRQNRAVIALEHVTSAVFGALQAEDAVFHSYAMRRHLLDLATVAVKNGEAATQADFFANLTDADVDQANADALMATFNNNNRLSSGMSHLKSALSEGGGLGANAKLAIELIVPFDRTPTNIIGRMFDYTPLGMILGSGGRHEQEMVLSSGDFVPTKITSKIKALEGLRKEKLLGANVSDRDIRVLQREAAKQLGRGSMGTMILIGAALGKLGTIMGLGDDDDNDRNEGTGAQKGSMLIGGRWVSLNRMQPIGSLLVLGATMQQSIERQASTGGVVGDVGMAALKQLMQIPSLRGFTDFGKAADDENKLEGFTGRMISSFIPTVIRDIADAGDNLQRDTRDQNLDVAGLFSVPVGPTMAAIPGVRETLPARKDFLGRDLPETHWAQAFFDPFNTTPSRSSGLDKDSVDKPAADDPVFKELQRLDVNITKPRKLPDETDAGYAQRLRVTGTASYRAVEKAIATQAYKDAAGLRAKSGKVKQKEWLEDRITDAKSEATSKLKKWAEAEGKPAKVAKEPEYPWEIEAAEKKANKMPSKPTLKTMMEEPLEAPEGF